MTDLRGPGAAPVSIAVAPLAWVDEPNALAQCAGRRPALRALLEDYVRDGVCVMRRGANIGLLDAAWDALDHARQIGQGLVGHREGQGCFAVDAGVAQAAMPSPYAVQNLHLTSPQVQQAIEQAPLIELASQILRGPLIVMASQMFRHASGKGAHADLPFFPLHSPRLALTAWIACEAADEDNGALYAYLGSHRLAEHRFANGGWQWTDGEDPAAIADYAQTCERMCRAHACRRRVFDVAPGDVVFLHPATVHGASPAASPHRTRKSIVVHVTTPRAGYAPPAPAATN